MVDYSYGGISAARILQALRGQQTRKIRYEYEVVGANGEPKGYVRCASAAIACDADARIHRTGKFIIWEKDIEKIDLLKDRIRPWMVLETTGGAARWPMGSYLLEAPKEGGKNVEVEGYDALKALDDAKLEKRLMVYAGTPYTEAAADIIQNAAGGQTIMLANIVQGTKNVPETIEYEMGTNLLDVANDLLLRAGYDPLRVDDAGWYVSQPYVPPTEKGADIHYNAKNGDLMSAQATISTNTYSLPNVYLAYVSSSDIDLSSKYEIINPESPISAARRGRRIVQTINASTLGITNQGELDAYVERVATSTARKAQQVSFATAAMPLHGVGSLLWIDHPEITVGLYRENKWSLELKPGALMQHTAERVVLL